MSLRKGEAKKNQKYKNKVAYEVRFNQKLMEVNSNVPLDHLCCRCMEQIKWKMQFGKYKPKTTLTRCNLCKEKRINKAYRTVCDKCADDKKLCAKCGQEKSIQEAPKENRKDRNGVDRDLLGKMESYMDDLRERSKRMIMRKLMKGEVEFEDGMFRSTETGEPIKGLSFKGDADDYEDNWGSDDEEDMDDDDDLGDDDDMDDDDEEEEAKVDKNKKDKGKEDKKVTIVEPKKEEAKGKGKDDKKADNKAAANKGKQPQKGKKKPDSDEDDDDDFDDDDNEDDEDDM